MKIKNIRSQLKSVLHQAKLDILQLQKFQDETVKIRDVSERLKLTVNQYKNFTTKKEITTVKLVDAAFYSTICSKCNVVCHADCSLTEMRSTGSLSFSKCACFHHGDTCRKCRGCSPEVHYHDNKEMIVVKTTVDEEIQDIKQKYIENAKLHDDVVKQMDQQLLLKHSIEHKIKTIQDNINTNCIELKKICKGFNLIDELNYLIHHLKQESHKLVSIETKQTAESFITNITQLVNDLSKSQSP